MAAIDFDEATKKWLDKKPTNFAIVIEGVFRYADQKDGEAISKENFVELLCFLQKRFSCRCFGIEHRGEKLPPEECAKQLENEANPIRKMELMRGLKPYHFHLVLMLPGDGVRIGTVFKAICDGLGVPFKVFDGEKLMPNPGVKIEVAHEPCIGVIRYLTHIDDPDKDLFSVDDVITNDQGYLRFCMECRNGILSVNALLRCMQVCDGSKAKLMGMVGLKFYNRYRWTIVDLLKEGAWRDNA